MQTDTRLALQRAADLLDDPIFVWHGSLLAQKNPTFIRQKIT